MFSIETHSETLLVSEIAGLVAINLPHKLKFLCWKCHVRKGVTIQFQLNENVYKVDLLLVLLD